MNKNNLTVFYNDGNYIYQLTSKDLSMDFFINIDTVTLVGFENCTRIQNNFLYGWGNTRCIIKSIDLSPLKNVVSIGKDFLSGYAGDIDLALMPNLKHYGNIIIKP